MKGLRLSVAVVVAVGIALAGLPVRAAERSTDNKGTKATKRAKVQQLYGITWYRSLDSALKVAQQETPPKPIFLLRALGDLDGRL